MLILKSTCFYSYQFNIPVAENLKKHLAKTEKLEPESKIYKTGGELVKSDYKINKSYIPKYSYVQKTESTCDTMQPVDVYDFVE